MAVTTAQVNAGKATVLDRAFIRYPAVRAPLIRIAVQAIKNGNAIEQEVGKAILNEAYQFIKGQNPNLNAVTKHEFKHLLYDGLQDDSNDPTTGVDVTDAFEAVEVTVI
jgi:hypothetical protein